MRGAIILSQAIFMMGCGAEDGAPRGDGRAGPRPMMTGAPMRIVDGDIAMMPGRGGAHEGLALGANGRHVLFLNFEGAEVRPGGSDAMENLGIRGMGKNEPIIEIDPYNPKDRERMKSILQIQKQVAAFYADVNLDVVLSRPLSGDYMMTVVGGDRSDLGFGGSIVGVSPGDCGNANEVDLNYAFSASLGHAERQTAITCAHEAGHAFGLMHTADNTDIMYPSVAPTIKAFARKDNPTVGTVACSGRPVQNSHEVLLANLGERDPSVPRPGAHEPPAVRFLEPADASEAPAGAQVAAEFTIAVSASAQLGVDRVTVSASPIAGGVARGGHPLVELRPPNSAARVKLSVAGDYQLLAAAYDRAGNVSIARSLIKVATLTCLVPNDCAPGQRCESNTCVTAPIEENPAAPMSGLRDYGTACLASQECKGGVCAPTPAGQICTHYCGAGRLCAGGLECVDGICMPVMIMRSEPKIGQLGGRCSRGQDCSSGECWAGSTVDLASQPYCTKVCDAQVAWSCPAGMRCEETGGATGMKGRCVFVPQAAMEEGGCAVRGARAGRPAEGIAMAWLALIGLALAGRRRARRS